ncbi:17706_t:CDS:2 [Gigaspora margarita]|uniref:Proline dehydrogenase n=1 Tax=Gigaspora margarita TaxID=4874 RepID=A0ABN7V1I3_GIGMA|nr:17706_t:CDS:2 [Gigaspora margarita]
MFRRALFKRNFNQRQFSNWNFTKTEVLLRSTIERKNFSQKSQIRFLTIHNINSNKFTSSSSKESTIPNNKVISFNEDSNIALRDKAMSELIRFYTVYKLLSIPWVVNYASSLISIPEKLHLSWLFNWIIKRTIFLQFCGGETDEECFDTMSKLKKHQIGTILGPSIESDLNQNGSLSDAEKDMKFNQIADEYLKCIKTASKQSNNFIAVKITGLSDPVIFKNLSLTLNSLNEIFDQFDNDQDGKLVKSDLKKLFIKIFGESETHLIDKVFDKTDSNYDRLIDRIDYYKILLNDQNILRLIMNKSTKMNQKMDNNFNQLLVRLDELCKTARQYKVKILIDAEQSYFQPSIDYIAMRLSLRYNNLLDEDGPIIFNTHQMYRKDSASRLQRDYELLRRNKSVFATKLVRGAYMVGERSRAKKLGYPDPIHDNKENTNKSYNGAVEFLLSKLYENKRNLEVKNVNDGSSHDLNVRNNPLEFMIASHNQETIIKACEKLDQFGIDLNSGAVYFAQLYGMCDQITYTLGHSDYPVYKYIAYGKVNEVIPFLVRRAQENSSIFDGRATVEQSMLWNEIVNRLIFWK